MSPILRDIKDAFDNYKRYAFDGNGNHKIGLDKICERAPFLKDNFWMNHYLFPEIIQFGGFACYHCSEEQVLRIMAEHGLL